MVEQSTVGPSATCGRNGKSFGTPLVKCTKYTLAHSAVHHICTPRVGNELTIPLKSRAFIGYGDNLFSCGSYVRLLLEIAKKMGLVNHLIARDKILVFLQLFFVNSGGATPLVDIGDIRFAEASLITCRQNFCEASLITCRQNFVCEAPSGARLSAVADVADA
ncbi:hypothetical protein EVAR_59671_1 [Eumeta japonica]|uniref:Uncharacterized protein n=1 Tax=Eumeta variegata TaxID=151549 RepID=A0A4C1Z3D7_EUMVA|nr:hypothetical protein EVAR_59671_1 [Eumeta japonica]